MSRGVQAAYIGGLVFQQTLGSLATLSRYETGVARSLQQSRHEFERLQARRRGEAVAAPVALDISAAMEISHESAPPKPSHARSQDARPIPASAAPAAGPSIEAPPQAPQHDS